MIEKHFAKLIGLILVMVGLWLALTVLSFSGVIEPGLTAADWWARFYEDLPRVAGMAGVGLLIAGVGGWLLTAPSRLDDLAESAKKARGEMID